MTVSCLGTMTPIPFRGLVSRSPNLDGYVPRERIGICDQDDTRRRRTPNRISTSTLAFDSVLAALRKVCPALHPQMIRTVEPSGLAFDLPSARRARLAQFGGEIQKQGLGNRIEADCLTFADRPSVGKRGETGDFA